MILLRTQAQLASCCIACFAQPIANADLVEREGLGRLLLIRLRIAQLHNQV